MRQQQSFPSLNDLAAFLESLEETIIVPLVGRGQFRHNPEVYQAGQSGFKNETAASLFEVRLRYQEQMDAVFGRYAVPEERPYSKELPPAQRISAEKPGLSFPLQDFNRVNLMPEIIDAYGKLVPKICRPGSDGQCGASVEYDILAVQALGRRIHFGAFYVAERKYRDDPDFYDTLIEAGDHPAILSTLRRPEVEERIISRVREKAETLQSCASPLRVRLDPEMVSAFYRDAVIPLTREGELRYFLNRRPGGP